VKNNNNFSLVVPIYNEAESIMPLFNEIKLSLSYEKINKIVFVDDGSEDQSKELIKTLVENFPNKIILLHHKHNMGQSFCLKTANEFLDDKYIITIDGDLQNDPKDIINLIELIEKDSFSLVGGIRSQRNDSLSKVYASKISNVVRKFILKDDCDDTGCSLKIFDREIFNSFPFFNGIHRFLPALYKGYGLKTKFIEVKHRKRFKGSSKYNNISRLFWTIKDLHRVYKHLKKRKNGKLS